MRQRLLLKLTPSCLWYPLTRELIKSIDGPFPERRSFRVTRWILLQDPNRHFENTEPPVTLLGELLPVEFPVLHIIVQQNEGDRYEDGCDGG
jgi:hypothetical protein